MGLIYKGAFPEHINGVPARDLSDSEVQDIARRWGLSLAETEGLLIKHGLYALVPKTATKTKPSAAESAPIESESE